jgi:hypothetical protein
MNYYLDHFTPYTWNAFQQYGSTVSGYPETARKRAAAVKVDDLFFCYLVGLSRWCGCLKVLDGPYIDDKPIFSPSKDKFVVRFRVQPIVALAPEHAIPIGELWNQLRCTKDLDRTKTGWAWSARLRSSLARMDPRDGQLIAERLQTQSEIRRSFPLDPAERRLLGRSPIRMEVFLNLASYRSFPG